MKYKVADYQEPNYYTPKTELLFDLGLSKTIVTAKYKVVLNKNLVGKDNPDIILDGHDDINLISLKINNQSLEQGKDFIIQDDGDYTLLTIQNKFGTCFELEQCCEINPEANLSYEGLYASDGGLVTQNESQGFRRIAYSIGRPDNLSVFTTTIIGNKTSFPVMLSNGNEVAVTEDRELKQNHHAKSYHDPFPKPYYLFALCCGDYFCTELAYQAMPSNSSKKLELYAPPFESKANVSFALDVLYRMMRWNEDKYNIELDLDEYKIVGVTRFNSGAMENKGLNVFSSSDVFLNPALSTDDNYKRVLTVVSHETAHNWAGNRVTVRDWSQLCLKEGLATHIEQQFSKDVLQSPVVRLENIQFLRNRQFAEDASYLAHPVHPKEFDSIDNFYTLTIYEKGAELLQTLEELLGEQAFIEGVKHYFAKYDSYNHIDSDHFMRGPTIEQFIDALADSTGQDLSQFKHWYDYAGTPELSITEAYNAKEATYTLTFEQYCLETSKQPGERPPFMIPVSLALYSEQGKKYKLESDDVKLINPTEAIAILVNKKQSFVFNNISAKPIPSLLRNFTAPVKITKDPLDKKASMLLIEHDDDPYVKWDRMQVLLTQEIVACYENNKSEDVRLSDEMISLYGKIIQDPSIAHDLKAKLLELPAYGYIAQVVETLYPQRLHQALKSIKQMLVKEHSDVIQQHRNNLFDLDTLDYKFDLNNTQAVKDRMLFLILQDLLCYSGQQAELDFALNTAKLKKNFTLIYSSYKSYFTALEDKITISDHAVIDDIYNLSTTDNNLREKWLSLQASIASKDAIDNIQALVSASKVGFDLAHPHQCYSLIRTFITHNVCFHEETGRGYDLAKDIIYDLDTKIKNHSIASRIAAALLPAKNLASEHKVQLEQKIYELRTRTGLSASLKEVLSAV